MEDRIIGALDRIREAQFQHTAKLDDIVSLLQQQPQPRREPFLDWSKLLPRIWWGLILLALLAAQVPLPEAIKIASRLF